MTSPSPVSTSPARDSESREAALAEIRLFVESPIAAARFQPVTVGVPFPRGLLDRASRLALYNPEGVAVGLQARPSARWPDGSIQWALLDFLAESPPAGETEWRLIIGEETERAPSRPPGEIAVEETAEALIVETGAARFRLDRRRLGPINQVEIGGERILDDALVSAVLTDSNGRIRSPRIERIRVEERGPVRATIRFEGSFQGRGRPCRFEARVSLFAGTALARVELTIHNPRRARHRGGLWDLGDPNSLFFRDLSLAIGLGTAGPLEVRWSEAPGQPVRRSGPPSLEIHQESSGGANWNSRNHVNRNGEVPLRFRGYRATADGRERRGDRASPIVELRSSSARVAAAVPEFWQQFPKAITADDRVLRVHLFPSQSADVFELQGGERKTHAVWLDFGAGGPPASAIDSLDWVHRPALVRCSPQWCVDAEVVPILPPVSEVVATPLDEYLAPFLDRPNDLDARREVVDEYGWRHHGELHADHEAAYYNGPAPIISHYNNQYDAILGLLTQYLRSGDSRWFRWADALARHVMDIDVYQTAKDKSAYSGGLFWHTDHYRDAATATHRGYSKANKRDPRHNYGGGPSSEHNYAAGLALFHHLTGSRRARETVTGLADWVIAMDDGSATVFGLVDDGPTGLASQTALSFHGPGRGCGNSINTLLDAWLLTEDQRYLDFAEHLIRRAVHPRMNIDEFDLLEVEARWSYTVFVVALSRYLALKRRRGALDPMFAYARACLTALAVWMVENERPYLDAPEKLRYPTETWAAQDLRKANAVRLAAEWVDEPLRGRFLAWGEAFADRAWNDLLGFESRHVIRAMAVVMTEGTRDLRLRLVAPPSPPPLGDDPDWGSPERFIPQKIRVVQSLKTPGGLARGLSRLVRISRWRRYLGRRRLPSHGATP